MTITALAEQAGSPSLSTPGGGRTRFHRGTGTRSAPTTVTLQIVLGDDVPDPVAAVRALMAHIGAVSELTLPPPMQLADAGPPERDPDDVPQGGPEPTSQTVRLDASGRSVSVDGKPVVLCRREFDLLLFLAEHPGRVFTRSQLLSAVWGDRFTGDRTIDVHITRLRSKLGVRQELITTVHGIGYRLAQDAPVAVEDPTTGTRSRTEPALVLHLGGTATGRAVPGAA